MFTFCVFTSVHVCSLVFTVYVCMMVQWYVFTCVFTSVFYSICMCSLFTGVYHVYVFTSEYVLTTVYVGSIFV